MGTAINVVICDLTKSVTFLVAAKAGLQRLFDQAIDARNLDVTVAVTFTTSAPAANGKDLLCYVVRSMGDSIITSAAFAAGATVPAGLSGFTIFKSDKTVASEVYANMLSDGTRASRLVFHELMHNMARVGNALHTRDMNLGAETVMDGTPLSAADTAWVARHLARTDRIQWTGGFTAYSDPLRGI